MEYYIQKVPYYGRQDKGYSNLAVSAIGYCVIQQALNCSAEPSRIIEDFVQKLMNLTSSTKHSQTIENSLKKLLTLQVIANWRND